MAGGYDGRGSAFPLTIVDGADMSFQLTATTDAAVAIDLSAATIAGELYNAAGTVVDTFSAAVSGAGSNVVTLSLTDTETGLLSGVKRWTLWVTRGGDKRPWLAGPATVVDGTRGRSATTGNFTLEVDTDVNVAVTVYAIGGTGGGASTLDDLTDVTITTPATDNVLKYNGSAWVNGTVAGNGDLLSTNNLSDVANAATARTNLGLAIGTNVQAYSAVLAATTASFTTADETKLDGIEAGATADQSAAELLTAIKTVDGSGSGLDADTLRGTTPTTAGLNLLDDADASAQRTTLGIGTIATQAANNVTITGGSVTGITDLAIADGGTGASTALGAVQNLRTAPATVTGTTDTLAAADDDTVILYTAAGAVTVTLANIATGFEAVLVSLGAGGLSVAAGGMSFANSFTPKLTVAQGEALYVKQTAASTWIVLGGTAT